MPTRLNKALAYVVQAERSAGAGNHIEHLKKKDLASPDETAGARAEDDAIQLPNDHFDDEDVYPDGN